MNNVWQRHFCKCFWILAFSGLSFANDIHNKLDARDFAGAREAIFRLKNTEAINECVNGWAPIHVAILMNAPLIVHALKDSGANMDLENGEKMTPLDLARSLKRATITKILEGQKFNLQYINKNVDENAASQSRKNHADDPELHKNAFLLFINNIIENQRNFKEIPTKKKTSDEPSIFYPLELVAKSFPFFISDYTLANALNELSPDYNSVIKRLLFFYSPDIFDFDKAAPVLNNLYDKISNTPSTIKKTTSDKAIRMRRLSFSEVFLSPRSDSNKKFSIDNWNAIIIANALTKRDANLIRAIDLHEIRVWLTDKSEDKSSAKIIRALNNYFDRTSSWFALQLASARDQNVRKQRLEKLIDVAFNLLDKNNDFSLMQLHTTVNKPGITKLVKDINLDNKYKKRFELIKARAKEILSGNRNVQEDQFVVFLPVELTNLVHIFDVINNAIGQTGLELNHLQALMTYRETLLLHRNSAYKSFSSIQDNKEIEEASNFLSNLSDIPTDVLEIYCYLHDQVLWGIQKQIIFPSPNLEKPFIDWDTKDLFGFLKEQWMAENNINKNYNATFKISDYNGENLISCFYEILDGELYDGYHILSNLISFNSSQAKINILHKNGLSYFAAAKLLMRIENFTAREKDVLEWNCIDIANWLSGYPKVLEKLFDKNIWNGKKLIEESEIYNNPQGWLSAAIKLQNTLEIPGELAYSFIREFGEKHIPDELAISI